jgi:uncharacterized protein (TIGR00369 family)
VILPEAALLVLRQIFEENIPHNRALGLKLVEVLDDGMVAALPYRADLVGNPETGFFHGGVITTLIDAACGMTIGIRQRKPMRVATLDLRIDYLRPAPPNQTVYCRASCYKTTPHIGFVRAVADCGDPESPVATAAGTFIIFDDAQKAKAP